jgi:hypothetical protein
MLVVLGSGREVSALNWNASAGGRKGCAYCLEVKRLKCTLGRYFRHHPSRRPEEERNYKAEEAVPDGNIRYRSRMTVVLICEVYRIQVVKSLR